MTTGPAEWRLLVLEPDAASAAQLKAALRRLQHARASVEHVLGASQAEQRLRKQDYDAFLVAVSVLDTQRQDRPHSVLERLSALAPETPLLLLLDAAPEEGTAYSLLEQASAFLLKTELTSGTLAAALEMAIRQHRLKVQLRAVLEASPDGMLVLGENGVVHYANAAAGAVYGRPVEALVGAPLDLSATLADRSEVGIGARTFELRRAPIEWGPAPAVLITLRDITERKAAELELAFRAEHDPLTGLVNSARLRRELRAALARAAREGIRVAVLYLDMDGFKVVNDLYGHEVGDTLLHQLAGRLAATCREGEVVGRLGGDEFAVVAEGVAAGTEPRIAERLMEVCREPLSAGRRAVQVSMSIGIASAPEDGQEVEALLHAADGAMYAAKRAGRNTYRQAGQAAATADERTALVAALRGALVRREFEVVYLPFVDLASGAVVGAEALVRWRREPDTLEEPAAFLDIAEETGLIVTLGECVTEALCAQWARWRWATGRELDLALNLSGRELRAPDLLARLRRILAAYGVPGRCLSLEVREDVLVRELDHVLAVAGALDGVSLAVGGMDGKALSLDRLSTLPVRVLKLSRWLVHSLPAGGTEAVLARGLIAFAQAVGLKVVAEGVETAEQAASLNKLGCDLAQGYFYSPGLAGDAFLALVQAPARLGHERAAETQ